MRVYLLRRLLLLVPTLIGITAVCFTLIQFVPGGPVEELISRVRAQSSLEGGGGSTAQQQITEEEIENIRAYYGFDKPAITRYFDWLSKVVRFDLGTSYFYEEPVWDVIKSKFPISLFFGLVSFVLSYSVCIPLGLYKAMWNRSRFDLISSIMVFAGYIIPGYALGILLIIFFSGGSYLDWFPLGGIVSENFESMGFWAGTIDFLHHMCLPLICFMASEFAFLTMLMKNSLLEEIRKEYVRTAMLKGAGFQHAIWKHALRNALIPLATRMSEIFTLMFTSALLIEKVFDIDGMGLLVYNSILSRDYNVVLGVILISSIMALLGRLFSDMLYIAIDPRIKFN